MTKFNYLIKENHVSHYPLMACEFGNSISVVQIRLWVIPEAACECFQEGGLIFDCVY